VYTVTLLAPPYHPVSSWQDGRYPVQSSEAPIPSRQRYQVIHWPGASNSTLAQAPGPQFDAEMVRLLRGEQQSYVLGRGYSLGYNWCVAPDDHDGWASVWEIRGSRYRCAANGDATTNIFGQAIQLKTPSYRRATPAQVRSVQWVIATQIRNLAPGAQIIVGHNQVRPEPTACPDPFIPDVNEGVFQPSVQPPPSDCYPKGYDPEKGDFGLYPFNMTKPPLGPGAGYTNGTQWLQQYCEYANWVMRVKAGRPYMRRCEEVVWTIQSMAGLMDIQNFVGRVPTGWMTKEDWNVIDVLAGNPNPNNRGG